ncbi:synaptotagmin-10-like isoform X2, partial [Paramuricea clavata]
MFQYASDSVHAQSVTWQLRESMGTKLNQTHEIAIALSIVVFALVLYMLVKIAGKRINVNGGRVYKNRRHATDKIWQKSAAKFHIVLLPEFPYGTLSESFIQPELFNQIPKVIEDDELPSDCSQNYAGTLYVNLRYDLTRSVLVVVLLKARDLPNNEANEINYYIIINLFPQKDRPCQSAVYKTSSPEFQEFFEFTIPLRYLLLQSLKFSLWSFDRFSHHEVIADTLVHLEELETYGLS